MNIMTDLNTIAEYLSFHLGYPVEEIRSLIEEAVKE